MENNQKAIVIGAGPAGLTAAHELQVKTMIYPLVLEASSEIGGISRTVCYKGNRMDIGGHRFFSKNEEIMQWWLDMMSLQGKPSHDDLLLDKTDKPFSIGGPDPEVKDHVMLVRERVSRIFYLRHFFDYPISLKKETFQNMGFWRTLAAGVGYLWSLVFKRKERSLEDFYINRFGAPLYRMFFEDYTEKVWGVHPSKLGADWGAQRVKGLSVLTILKNMLHKPQKLEGTDWRQKNVETSLIEKFLYPKYGPGQLWEFIAKDVVATGGEVRREAKVEKVHIDGDRVTGVSVRQGDQLVEESCDYLFSSMPLKDLVEAIDGIEVPADVRRIASTLPYRDFITVGLLVDRMKIKNQTPLKTFDDRIPDTWIYIQERNVRIGRLQVFNNWSPYLVKDYEHTIWLGLEYFCTEGDVMWNMSEKAFIDMAIAELVKIGMIDASDVLDSVQVKVKKAYPAYYGSYYELGKVRKFLDSIKNLYCIGRNGQHRYNNMDHSMLTAMEAIRNLRGRMRTKDNVWNVNTEGEYHETKRY